eukprot:TRINITY_DN1393_c0_g1_i1.p1 TRINITY_DN1393_c0_g1~~TRINITY_DN1393_c0_g1_i1.p1  ORF type:complete len:260 (+),score=34.64 TRINITY_DN1393_c0_g1_i1:80-859(+)
MTTPELTLLKTNTQKLKADVNMLQDLVLSLATELQVQHLVPPSLNHHVLAPPDSNNQQSQQPQHPAPPPPLPPPPPPQTHNAAPHGTIPFRHQHGKGLIYQIGTDFGRRPWQNPNPDQVSVSASSIKHGDPSMVVDSQFSNQVFFTANLPSSWVVIELKNYKVRPTGYTMAHRAGKIGYFMRNWQLSGSIDGSHWDLLTTHKDDTTLDQNNYIASWAINNISQSYSKFRIMMAPGGNEKGTGALVIACFEVYGDWEECR